MTSKAKRAEIEYDKLSDAEKVERLEKCAYNYLGWLGADVLGYKQDCTIYWEDVKKAAAE